MAKDVPCLMKNINLHIQEVQLAPSRTNIKRSILKTYNSPIPERQIQTRNLESQKRKMIQT